MGTLWAALEALPDRRTRKGRRYALSSIVCISLAALLSGANDLMAIHRWGRRLTPKGLEAFGITRGRAPCHATYHYVLRAVAVADLDRALGGLASVGDGLGHVAIDGKRLRGSRHETSPGIHLLSAFSTKLQATVGTLVVPPDSAEAVAAIELIKALPLASGDVVTGDAAITLPPGHRGARGKGRGLLPVGQSQPARASS